MLYSTALSPIFQFCTEIYMYILISAKVRRYVKFTLFSWIIGVFLCLHICVVPFKKNCLCILVRCNGVVIISQIYCALTLCCTYRHPGIHSLFFALTVSFSELIYRAFLVYPHATISSQNFLLCLFTNLHFK